MTDYPAAIKAFYMYLNQDERTVAAMDVLVPRIGEIIGGSQREHRGGEGRHTAPARATRTPVRRQLAVETSQA